MIVKVAASLRMLLAAIAALMVASSASAQPGGPWRETFRDRNLIVARDISFPSPASSDGTVVRRLAMGFPATWNSAATDTLKARRGDFLLMTVRVDCRAKRVVKYLTALAIPLEGGGGGQLNIYYERFDGLEAQLPATANRAVVATACGKYAKDGYDEPAYLLQQYRARR